MCKQRLYLPFFLCFLITFSAFGSSPFGTIATIVPTGYCQVTSGNTYRIFVKTSGLNHWGTNDASVVVWDSVFAVTSLFTWHWLPGSTYEGYYANNTPTYGIGFEYLYIFGITGYDDIVYQISGGQGDYYFVMLPSNSTDDTGTWDRMYRSDVGTWGYLNSTYYSPPHDNPNCWARYEKDYTNFSMTGGFWQNITFREPFDVDFGWEWSGDRWIILNWTYSRDWEYLSLIIKIHLHDDILHTSNYRDATIELYSNSTNMGYTYTIFDNPPSGFNGWLFGGNSAYFPVRRDGTLTFYLYPLDDLYHVGYAINVTTYNQDYNYTFNPIYWAATNSFGAHMFDDNALLQFTVKVQGSAGDTDMISDHHFEYHETELSSRAPYVMEPPTVGDVFSRFFSWLGTNLASVIPPDIANALKMMGGWFSPLYIILAIVWDIFLRLLPFAPFLVLFWALDATIASISTGSFTPIGNFTSMIWNITVSVIGAISGIAGTLWSIIKFW